MPIGVDDNGEVVFIRLLGHSVLIGGLPGSGKSLGCRTMLAGLAASRDVCLVGIDPKRAELILWRDRFSHLVLGHEADETIELLQLLLDEVHQRAVYLATTGRATLEPSAEYPNIVLVIDEWAEMAAGGTAKERALAAEMLRRFVSLGRAVNGTVILLTQKPTNEVIDTGTRSLLGYRFALRCGDRFQADSILGAGAYEASQLIGAAPGRALWTDGGAASALQFYEIEDQQVAELQCAGLVGLFRSP